MAQDSSVTSGGPPDPSRSSTWASQPLPDLSLDLLTLWVGLPTPPVLPRGPLDPPRPPCGLPGHLGSPSDPSRAYRWAFDLSRHSRLASRPIQELWDRLPKPPGPTGVPRDPSQTSRRASRQLPDNRVGLPTPSELGVGLLTIPGPPGGHPDPSQTLGWSSKPHSNLRVSFPNPPGSQGGPPDPSRTSS